MKTLSKVFPFEKRGCRYGAQKIENVTYYVDPFFHKGMHAIFCRSELEWKRQRKLAGTWQAFGGLKKNNNQIVIDDICFPFYLLFIL